MSGETRVDEAARPYEATQLLKPRAAASWLALIAEIRDAEARGRRTPCIVDPDPYTSDRHEERAEAAAACVVCPVLVECARFALANDERAYVWGGVDLSPRRGARRNPRAELEQLLGEAGPVVTARSKPTGRREAGGARC